MVAWLKGQGFVVTCLSPSEAYTGETSSNPTNYDHDVILIITKIS
jgi:hypothetical protein